MIASVKFHLPQLKSARQTCLPESQQSLRGWRKLDPPKSPLPLPWEAVCLMSKFMVGHNMVQEAMMMLLSFVGYLRPGELTEIRVQGFIPPVTTCRGSLKHWSLVLHPLEQGVASKTEEYDETLIFDLPYNNVVNVVAQAVFRIRQLHLKEASQLVFDKDIPRLRACMQRASEKCGLEILGDPHSYRLRHGGASRDLTKKRDLLQIQHRGRWKTQASVRRYQKGGRLIQLLHSLPRKVLADAMSAANGLEQMLLSLR